MYVIRRLNFTPANFELSRSILRINTPNVAIEDSRKDYRTFLLIQTHVLWSLWVKRRDFTARDKEKNDPAGTPGGCNLRILLTNPSDGTMHLIPDRCVDRDFQSM